MRPPVRERGCGFRRNVEFCLFVVVRPPCPGAGVPRRDNPTRYPARTRDPARTPGTSADPGTGADHYQQRGGKRPRCVGLADAAATRKDEERPSKRLVRPLHGRSTAARPLLRGCSPAASWPLPARSRVAGRARKIGKGVKDGKGGGTDGTDGTAEREVGWGGWTGRSR